MAIDPEQLESQVKRSVDALLQAVSSNELTAGSARVALQTIPGQHSHVESYLMDMDDDDPLPSNPSSFVADVMAAAEDFEQQLDEAIENDAIFNTPEPGYDDDLPMTDASASVEGSPPVEAYDESFEYVDPMSEYESMGPPVEPQDSPAEEPQGQSISSDGSGLQQAGVGEDNTGPIEQLKLMTADEFEQMWDDSLQAINENFALNRHEHRHIKVILRRILADYLREGSEHIPIGALEDLLETNNYTYKSNHPLRQILDYHLNIAGDNKEYLVPAAHFGPKWMEFYTREIAPDLSGSKPMVEESTPEVASPGASASGGGPAPQANPDGEGDPEKNPPRQQAQGHPVQGGFNIAFGGGQGPSMLGKAVDKLSGGVNTVFGAASEAVKGSAALTNNIVTKLSDVRAERVAAATARQDLQVEAIDKLEKTITKVQNGYVRYRGAKVREREPEAIKLKRSLLQAMNSMEALANPKLAKSMPAGLKERLKVHQKALKSTLGLIKEDKTLDKTKIGKSISDIVSKLTDMLAAIAKVFKIDIGNKQQGPEPDQAVASASPGRA